MAGPGKEVKGVTLVELLVVIGIIAVLAGISLPIISSMTKQAKITTCGQNLRQIGAATSLYLADNQDTYMWAADPVEIKFIDSWNGELSRFADVIRQMPTFRDALSQYVKSPSIFACPLDNGSAWYPTLENPPVNRPSDYAAVGSSYCYNTILGIRSYRLSTVSQPSQVFVSADSFGHWHGNGRELTVERFYSEGSAASDSFVRNVLFADLHLRAVDENQFKSVGSSSFDPFYKD